jgi:hypothetical protein
MAPYDAVTGAGKRASRIPAEGGKMQSLIVLMSLMLGVTEPAASPPDSEGLIAGHFGKAYFLS